MLKTQTKQGSRIQNNINKTKSFATKNFKLNDMQYPHLFCLSKLHFYLRLRLNLLSLRNIKNVPDNKDFYSNNDNQDITLYVTSCILSG